MVTCKVKNCEKPLKARGFCAKHWSQMDRRGKITRRNRLSPNEFITNGEVTEIILCDTYGDEVTRAVIDSTNKHLASQYKWYLSNSGYAISRVSENEQVFLHRLILNPKEGLFVDHIDGNPLNNKLENLRECTHQQNIMNQKLRKDNTSGHKGVGWCNRKKRWRSRIHVDGKDVHLGYYQDKESAISSRLSAERKYFGEFKRKRGGVNGIQ